MPLPAFLFFFPDFFFFFLTMDKGMPLLCSKEVLKIKFILLIRKQDNQNSEAIYIIHMCVV